MLGPVWAAHPRRLDAEEAEPTRSQAAASLAVQPKVEYRDLESWVQLRAQSVYRHPRAVAPEPSGL